MFDVLTLLEARLAQLLTGKLFDKPGGGTSAMNVVKLGLQPQRIVEGEEDHPFLLLKLRHGIDGAGESTLLVELIVGLYVNPDTDADSDVDTDDDQVTAAALAMTEVITVFRALAADGNYYPYSLERITWRIGDKDGFHPSPDYFELQAELVFSQAPVL